jgi:adenine-specific DNA-methyltransferase
VSESGALLWEQGAVYTRSWVAELILDLAGYDPERDLSATVLVEPACGDGEFLEPAIRRLRESCRTHGRDLRECRGAIRAVDVDPGAVDASQTRVERVLVECGQDRESARQMSRAWVRQADFLLDPHLELELRAGGGADFVVGNPPYVRLESIDAGITEKYRKICRTMTHRADLYVGFYERALEMLGESGVCTFICADRWMLNQYGSALRRLVTTGGFSVEAVIEMHRAEAFQDEVLAYPAITSIRSGRQGRVLVARVDNASKAVFERLVEAARRAQGRDPEAERVRTTNEETEYVVVDEWFRGSDPWPSASPERLRLLKHLEAKFPPLESEKTRVGIGVATGADSVFITRNRNLVEPERLLPIARVRDTFGGTLHWSGEYLVNPWKEDGSLVELERYPRLGRYFERHESALKRRHVAKKNPRRWYRTIDKVNSNLTDREKLLIPDIKGYAHPVYDAGGLYPHHNLYYVVSNEWDLKVLGGLLLSNVGQFFIECYAVRMNGGYLRFQAQYLRRIRVPKPHQLTEEQARNLKWAFEERDVEAATATALEVYGIERIPE